MKRKSWKQIYASKNEIEEKYVVAMEEARSLAYKLYQECEEKIAHRNKMNLHYGHVGDANYLLKCLKEITENK